MLAGRRAIPELGMHLGDARVRVGLHLAVVGLGGHGQRFTVTAQRLVRPTRRCMRGPQRVQDLGDEFRVAYGTSGHQRFVVIPQCLLAVAAHQGGDAENA
jgi:hypothetical protein